MKKLIVFLIILILNISHVFAQIVVNVEVPIEYVFVSPGKEISINIGITKFGDGREDINLKLFLKGENTEILLKNYFLAIDKSLNTVLTVNIPTYVKEDIYDIEIVVNDKYKDAAQIKVSEEKVNDNNKFILYTLISIIVVFLIIFIIYYRKLNKVIAHIEKVDIGDIVK